MFIQKYIDFTYRFKLSRPSELALRWVGIGVGLAIIMQAIPALPAKTGYAASATLFFPPAFS
jgi:hypothetical protein